MGVSGHTSDESAATRTTSREQHGQMESPLSDEKFDALEKEEEALDAVDDSSQASSHTQTHETSRSRTGSEGPGIYRNVSEVRDGFPNQREVEMGQETKEEQAGEDPVDPNLVKWDGPNDPENPKNWKDSKRWAAVVCVSFFTLISPTASSMTAPALVDIGRQLNITSSFQLALSLSIFVLAYALGPLIWGPLSELYGRVIIIQVSNFWFLIFNLACGLSHNEGELVAFRFLAGIGGSAPLAIGGGVVGDIFAADERGRAMAMYVLTPVLGPAIGPIAGGWISERTSWRWIFYASTIACGVIQGAGLIWLRESYGPVLLQRRKLRLIKETGNTALHTEYDDPSRTFMQTLGRALRRPLALLAMEPILQALAAYLAFLYGMMYLLFTTFPTLWTEKYHESTGIGSLNYISLGLGFALGSQICAPLQDRIYAGLKARYGLTQGVPEFRLPLLVPGMFLFPVGLLIYSWTAQFKTHWIGPNIGAAILGCGLVMCFQCAQGYIVDAYTRFAASALAGATMLRSLAGFGFPLFAPAMYAKLDYGWGGTMLALLAIVIGWPSPFLLWKYGAKLRQMSKYAA